MEPTLVVPGVHLLPFEIGQAYLWDWGNGVTVIDTGAAGNEEAILVGLRFIGRRPADVTEIVLTHYHDDHRGSARALAESTGAVVVAHELDAPVIAGEQPATPPNLTEVERPFAEQITPQVPPAPPVRVGRQVRDGDAIRGGGVIVSVPGHTPGSIAVHVPELALLFTGDTIASVEGQPILGPFNIDRAEAKLSVKKQAGLQFEVACFGHGDPLVGDALTKIRDLANRL
jgi:glyoxylase-like metal-dependent hydrolase (beta-lactamase superfamily II)